MYTVYTYVECMTKKKKVTRTHPFPYPTCVSQLYDLKDTKIHSRVDTQARVWSWV